MRSYSTKISLTKNARGIYSLDPTLGCNSGTSEGKAKGCYNDCYAAKISKMYGYDFNKTVLRSFTNETHKHKIRKQITKIPLPFVRMGTMGDPSENWEHTLNICRIISDTHQLNLFPQSKKEIVIITKHWKSLTESQLLELSKYGICINTSISALDEYLVDTALCEYERIKPYCKSILRIVSCDFNLANKTGHRLHKIQERLFKSGAILDTVFRVSRKNKLVLDGVINIKESKFLGKKCYISKYNKKTYFGKCSTCLEMCGVKL